jgi:hypothetical protein
MTAGRVRIEILTFADCPNAETTRERVSQALEHEAVDAEIVEVPVETPEAAQELHFLGSPSVRVNGQDVDVSVDDARAYGFMCRTYRDGFHVEVAPSTALIRNAIRSAI